MRHEEGWPTGDADALVGREPELDGLAALLLEAAPLITVVGPGGAGKTRLAAEATRRYRRASGTPVHWIRLSRLPAAADAAAVTDEMMRAVAAGDIPGSSSRQALVSAFERSGSAGESVRAVLVVDNCEHVHAGAGFVVARLLDTVPGLTVLATSRQPLGDPRERLLPVPPLTRAQAVTLFRRRASLTDTVIADDQVPIVESICRRVNNQPLHIRLAAARVRYQPLRAILADLSGTATDRRLRWPRGPRGGVEARHHSMADVIAWSFELCGEKERLLFERMSIFAAGYDNNSAEESKTDVGCHAGVTAAAIRAVCGGSDSAGAVLNPDEIEPLLELLSDRSLVSVDTSTAARRYWLSDNFRVFAAERLRERDRAEPTRLSGAYCRYYRDKVAEAVSAWRETPDRRLLDWASDEWDNLLSVLEISLAAPDRAVIGLEIATGLFALNVPFFNGRTRDACRWAERTLAATRDADPKPVDLQIAAMGLIARIKLSEGRPDEARRLVKSGMELSRVAAADRIAWREHPDRDVGLPATLEFATGALLMFEHEDSGAVDALRRASAKFARAQNRGGSAVAEGFAVLAAALLKPPDQALDITGRHLAGTGRAGDNGVRAWAETASAIARIRYGNPRSALAVGRESLRRMLDTRDTWGALWAAHVCVWALAHETVGARTGRREPTRRAPEVARLLGGLAAVRERLGTDITTLRPFASETARADEAVRTALGRRLFDAARGDGTGLRPALPELCEWILAVSAPDWSPPADPHRRDKASSWQRLSAAEIDVAALAAAGWTNTAIARQRGSSRRTVETQIANILNKLTIGSRTEIRSALPPEYRRIIDTDA
ncbi:ATP-binding protein [Nocardia blacklockiae]|uniref:ATP-binding protein n=1 Tax=Nocardia blacklockiae TaxID=480036 RepID=UPI0018953A45|nr:AAA family ATPase [Nocardia blacklockiae]MBF6173272.1 hypothetical protein [Nocardia blacklockiae]